ncbi:MAG: hypothetical protein ACYDBT_08535 [Desulfobulbaceae bacterium]
MKTIKKAARLQRQRAAFFYLAGSVSGSNKLIYSLVVDPDSDTDTDKRTTAPSGASPFSGSGPETERKWFDDTPN